MALADLDEQLKPLARGEIVLVAVLGDFDAAHQFHDEIRPARFGRAGIQNLGDVGMVHHGQRLPFGFEPGDDALGVHAQLDDLERDPPANRLLLFGHINHAAAAFADFLQQFVAADAGSEAFVSKDDSAVESPPDSPEMAVGKSRGIASLKKFSPSFGFQQRLNAQPQIRLSAHRPDPEMPGQAVGSPRFRAASNNDSSLGFS